MMSNIESLQLNTDKNKNNQAPLACRNNTKIVENRLVVQNKDYNYNSAKWIIDYKQLRPDAVILVAMHYLQLLSTNLAKLVVYCNPSEHEDLDIKFTIKYIPCYFNRNNNAKINNNIFVDKVSGNTEKTFGAWEVRFNPPGSSYNVSSERKALIFKSKHKIINFILKNGVHVNLVELCKRGVKVSDDIEKITLFYIPF